MKQLEGKAIVHPTDVTNLLHDTLELMEVQLCLDHKKRLRKQE
jgi:hypothetical protein